MSLSESSALVDSLEFAGTMLERHDIADCSSPGLLEVSLFGGFGILIKLSLLIRVEVENLTSTQKWSSASK